MRLKHLAVILLVLITSLFLIGLAVKGSAGNPVANQNNDNILLGGPFESSGSTSRFALTEAIFKTHSFFLNPSQVTFAFPDVTRVGSKYISIFEPGISFIGLPFYALGSQLGLPQLGAYLAVTMFAVLNIFLITIVARKLGVQVYFAILSGLIFAFATNALSYGTTYTQHEVSVTIVLLALMSAFGERNWLKNVAFGLLVGAGALVDIPNIIFLSPIGIYIIFKHFKSSGSGATFSLSIKTAIIGLFIGMLPFIALFAYYNHQTTGSYVKIAQLIGRSPDINQAKSAQPVPEVQSTQSNIVLLNTPFETRLELSGFYTLLISNERSWIFYSPVVLLGILGLYFSFKSKQGEKRDLAILLSSVILINIILYTMFGDPWGGWSFGPRYLIPSAALLCTALGVAMQRFKTNYVFIAVFLPILFYSVAVNTLGAITTQSIPPKIEATHLSKPIPYTYQYNFELLKGGESSSLIYNLALRKDVNPILFWEFYAVSAFLFLGAVYIIALKQRSEEL